MMIKMAAQSHSSDGSSFCSRSAYSRYRRFHLRRREFVGGILVGATIVAIPRAIFMGNSGGAFDNAKKYIESGQLEGCKKDLLHTGHQLPVIQLETRVRML